VVAKSSDVILQRFINTVIHAITNQYFQCQKATYSLGNWLGSGDPHSYSHGYPRVNFFPKTSKNPGCVFRKTETCLSKKYTDTDATLAIQRGNTDTNEDSHNHRLPELPPAVNVDARGSIFYSGPGVEQVIPLGRMETFNPHGRTARPNAS
jgi:hypothetical protein